MPPITTIAFFILFLLLPSCASQKQSRDVLYTFDTVKMGSGNMDIKIEELENHGNYSLIREQVYKRGSYAGSIMFSICSSSVIAKKRGYSYLAHLKIKNFEGCETCEMSWDKTIGFLNDVPDELLHSPEAQKETDREKGLRMTKVSEYVKSNFPNNLTNEKDIEIIAVQDFWLICKDVNKICSW